MVIIYRKNATADAIFLTRKHAYKEATIAQKRFTFVSLTPPKGSILVSVDYPSCLSPAKLGIYKYIHEGPLPPPIDFTKFNQSLPSSPFRHPQKHTTQGIAALSGDKRRAIALPATTPAADEAKRFAAQGIAFGT